MKARRGAFSSLLLVGALATLGGVPAGAEERATATFAGGCFWCMQPPFEKLEGVISTTVGYTGGHTKNPTYEEVSAGGTGHAESVEIVYDPGKIGYAKLLDVFWHNVDPLTPEAQFCDHGHQYRTAIFYHDDTQRRLAEESKQRLAQRFGRPIATEIVAATTFYPAEEYHQRYHEKNPVRYKFYRWNCGRDARLKELWGDEAPAAEAQSMPTKGWNPVTFKKPDDPALRKSLDPMQYKVTQQEGTEPPFHNEYWDNHRPGIYVDVVSGEPVFSSLDKYDSGTGWPSFTKPLDPGNIREREDRRLFTSRTEIRSAHADSHLGHVFDDGPAPTGKRYCMNPPARRPSSAPSRVPAHSRSRSASPSRRPAGSSRASSRASTSSWPRSKQRSPTRSSSRAPPTGSRSASGASRSAWSPTSRPGTIPGTWAPTSSCPRCSPATPCSTSRASSRRSPAWRSRSCCTRPAYPPPCSRRSWAAARWVRCSSRSRSTPSALRARTRRASRWR